MRALKHNDVILAALLNLVLAAASKFILGGYFSWIVDTRFANDQLISVGLPLMQFLAFGFLADRAVKLMLSRLTKIGQRGISKLMAQLVTVLIYFCTFLFVISKVFNQSIQGIVAASGAAGLVVGFALRGLAADLFSGIALHFDPNFNAGDWVEINYRGRDIMAKLKDIHWRVLVLEDRSRNQLLIPNSEFAASLVGNRSRGRGDSEFYAAITLGNEHPPERILNILNTALTQCADQGVILRIPSPYIAIHSFEQGIIQYRLYFSVDMNKSDLIIARGEVLKNALRTLHASGTYLYPILPNYGNPEKPLSTRPEIFQVRQRILEGVLLFRSLGPAELESVAEQAEVLHKQAGETLIEQGEIDDSLMIVAEGCLDVFVKRDNESLRVAALWPGDFVGEMSLLTGAPRSATVIPRTSACLVVIRKPMLAKILTDNPNLATTLAQVVEQRRNRFPDGDQTTGNDDGDSRAPLIERIRQFFGL